MITRAKRPPNRLLAAIIVGIVVLATLIAAVSQSVSTSRRSGDDGDTNQMVVSDIQLTSRGRPRLNAMVEVQSNDNPVTNATIRSQLLLPSGQQIHVDGTTNETGRFVHAFRLAGPGTYQFVVVDVTKSGMSFDKDNSVTLDASIQIGDNVEPTPTEDNPTATEVNPTATEVDPTATEVEPTATDSESEDPTATDTPPTATPTEADEPPTATPTHSNPPSSGTSEWHSPTDHEHGDPPPEWVTNWSMNAFGHGVIYGGDEQTPNENALKHNAFKAFAATMDGVDLYFRVHAQSNPHGRAGQFHSYEIYARDPSGNVSFWQGWKDCGSPDTARFPRSQGDPGERPGMLVVDQAAWDQGIRFEQWYCMGPAWSWDLGWAIGETTTIWHPGEHLNNPHDQANWTTTGSEGLTRRIEAAWYGPNSQYAPNRGNPPRGVWFCATPQGQITNSSASGPNDCGDDLPQFIALSMVAVEFPDNAVQKAFPGGDSLSLPN